MAYNNILSRYWEAGKYHLRKNTAVLIWIGVFCIVGIVIGIALLFGEKSYLNLLTTSNQNMLGYISGSAKIFSLFWKRLFSSFFAVSILFTLSLNFYTSFLCFIYFAYQSALCTIVCGTLITYQGFAAILNTILLIIPSNLILLVVLALMFSVLFSRAYQQNKYKQNFSNSFSYNNFWINYTTCVVAIIVLHILVSLIIPSIIKGIYLIYY